MNKIIIIGLSIVLLFILISGAYFLTSGNKPDNLLMQKSKLEEAIIAAGKKLDKEKETLKTMTDDLRNSFSLAMNVQDQMKKSIDLIEQTDFMFTDSDGSNPELLVKNFSTNILINDERKKINLMLLEWQKQINLLAVEEIDVNASEKIKKDVEAIKTFLENLFQFVENLTPGNSELSQFQIDTYIAQLPSIEEVNKVLISIETAIENDDLPLSNTETSVGTGNNQTSSSGESNVAVTPANVVAQQEIVMETQNEIAVLQEQLTEVEVQIEQNSPPSVEGDTTANSDSENQDTDSGDETDTPVNVAPRQIEPSQGIIIQPGDPRLIQGTDPF